MITKSYSAPRAEVRNTSIRASILAGSNKSCGAGVTGNDIPWDDGARKRSTVEVDASRD